MEIIHLWIRNLRGVENVNYRFNSKFNVAVNLDVPNFKISVSIESKQEVVEDFYGENFINVNCIVGGNGSGKTTLLQLLADILCKQFKYGMSEYVLVTYEKNTNSFSCTHNLNSGYQLSFLELQGVRNKGEEKEYEVSLYTPEGYGTQGYDLGRRSAAIYYTPIVNFSDWHANRPNSSLIDVSTDYLLRKDFELVDTEIDLIENHRQFNFQRQITLSQKFLRDGLVEAFPLPDTVLLSSLEPSYDQRWDHNISSSYRPIRVYFLGGETPGKRGYFDEKIHQIGGEKYILREKGEIDSFPKLEHQRTIWNYLRDFVDHYFSMMNRENHWQDLDAGFSLDTFSGEGFFDQARQFFTHENWLKDKGEAALSLLACLQGFFESGALMNADGSTDYRKCYTKDFNQIKALLRAQEAYLQSIPGLVPPERAPSLYHVGWRDMSSGEKAYLDLFSRLNYAFDLLQRKGGETSEIFYLFLDEGELGFHPEWQKKYVRLLLASLSSIFEGLQIQVFIASHSPFVVSDFHPDSVLYLDDLERDKGMSLFGANIHTVFSEGFGVADGLVGEFAKHKIQEVIDLLNSEAPVEELENKVAPVISLIGEPIVRKKLTKMLDEKLGRSPKLMMIDAEIQRLQELKKQIEMNDDKDPK